MYTKRIALLLGLIMASTASFGASRLSPACKVSYSEKEMQYQIVVDDDERFAVITLNPKSHWQVNLSGGIALPFTYSEPEAAIAAVCSNRKQIDDSSQENL